MILCCKGYEAEVPSKRHGLLKLKVCVSCARAMRGRHKLEAVPPNTPFYCAMGDGEFLQDLFGMILIIIAMETHFIHS